MTRGFYSVVQYCPDRFRAETVNVGLVLLRPEPHTVRVRMATHFDRVMGLFTLPKLNPKAFTLLLQGMANRIEMSSPEIRTEQDLLTFAATRANDLRLTEPRLATLEDFDLDFERLFAKLVEEKSTKSKANELPAQVLPPKLGEVFYRLSELHKIWNPRKILVPVLKRKIEIPYAYKNGVVNLVLPHTFANGKRAESQAVNLAVNGQLIQKHTIDGEPHKLIVISTQESDKQQCEITEHIEPLFRDLGVRLVRPNEADAYAAEVEKTAH